MIIHAAHRDRADTAAEPHLWTVEADDSREGYEQALAKIKETVPDGAVLLYVRPVRV